MITIGMLAVALDERVAEAKALVAKVLVAKVVVAKEVDQLVNAVDQVTGLHPI